MSTNSLSGACCFASSTQPKTPWKLMFLSVVLDIPDLPQRKEVASGGRNQWFTGRTIGICCISHQAGVDDLQVNHVFFLNLWRIEPSRFQDFFLDKSVVYLGEKVHRRIAISTWFCKRRQDLDMSLQPILESAKSIVWVWECLLLTTQKPKESSCCAITSVLHRRTSMALMFLCAIIWWCRNHKWYQLASCAETIVPFVWYEFIYIEGNPMRSTSRKPMAALCDDLSFTLVPHDILSKKKDETHKGISWVLHGPTENNRALVLKRLRSLNDLTYFFEIGEVTLQFVQMHLHIAHRWSYEISI